MSITFDAASNGNTASGTSLTVAHTCTGSNRLLLACVEHDPSQTPTATYAGAAMTNLGSQSDGNNNWKVTMFYKVTPATGANNIIFSIGSASRLRSANASYTDCDPGIQLRVTQGSSKASGGASTLNNTLTTLINNCLHVGVGTVGAGTPAAGTNTTSRASNNTVIFLEKNAVTSPQGSSTIQLSDGGSASEMGIFGAAIYPFGASLVTINESISITEDYDLVRGAVINVNESISLTEDYEVTAPRITWTRESRSDSTWANENKS